MIIVQTHPRSRGAQQITIIIIIIIIMPTLEQSAGAGVGKLSSERVSLLGAAQQFTLHLINVSDLTSGGGVSLCGSYLWVAQTLSKPRP